MYHRSIFATAALVATLAACSAVSDDTSVSGASAATTVPDEDRRTAFPNQAPVDLTTYTGAGRAEWKAFFERFCEVPGTTCACQESEEIPCTQTTATDPRDRTDKNTEEQVLGFITEVDHRHPDRRPIDKSKVVDFVAVFAYAGDEDYRAINHALHSRDPEQLAFWAGYVKSLAAGVNQLPAFEGKTVYRMTSPSALPEYRDAKTSGRLSVERAFLSTSTREQATCKFRAEVGTSLAIRVEPRAHGHGRDISGFTGHPEEAEVLFPPGTAFTVAKITAGAKLHCEEENVDVDVTRVDLVEE